MSEYVKIQANVSGYHGKGVTVLSVYAPSSGVLRIAKIVEKKRDRVPGSVVVSTDPSDDFDTLMKQESFADAIRAYFELERSESGGASRLTYANEATRANPNSSLQVVGYEETGPKTQVSSDITNERVAVLATCLVAKSQRSLGGMARMADALATLRAGGIFTI